MRNDRNVAEQALMPKGGLLLSKDHSMALLLGLLVSAVFVVPLVAPSEDFAHRVTNWLIVAFLLCGLRAVAEYRRILLVLVPLSVVAIGIRFAEWFVPDALLPALGEISTLLAMLVLAVAVGFTVFGSGQSVRERILGAVVLYLLIGISFAVIYEIVAVHHSQAFSGDTDLDHGVARWVYFSFVTLTTVGFGDVVPTARAARALTILEALIGQLYPAIILARLVSLPTPENSPQARQ
jgi:hypothetical protein